MQRVKHAKVEVKQQVVGEISHGLLLFLGIEKQDDKQIADKLIKKVINYRIFSDAVGKMNCSLREVKGQCLVVSQFTLAADTQKGLRPSFSSAMPPAESEVLYQYFVAQMRQQIVQVQTGTFGADMQVSLLNDGPVTFVLEG